MVKLCKIFFILKNVEIKSWYRFIKYGQKILKSKKKKRWKQIRFNRKTLKQTENAFYYMLHKAKRNADKIFWKA